MEKLARLAGYRFVLRNILHPKSITAATPIKVKMTWANVGVAKLYHPYELQLELINEQGKPVTKVVVDTDPRDWLPGEQIITTQLPTNGLVPGQISLATTGLPPGRYTLTVALRDKTQHLPAIKLAMDAPEKDGRYTVGKIEITRR